MILITICDIILFSVIILIVYHFKDKLYSYLNKIDNNNVVNNEKLVPIEQIQEFRQLFYLIFAGFLFVNVYYLMFISAGMETFWFCSLMDFSLSVLAAVYIIDKEKKLKTLILLLVLVPLTGYSLAGSMGGMNDVLFTIFGLIHSAGILYIIALLIIDFKSYSESNKLGYTIFILYIIIFICVFLSSISENLSLLDSLVYCSNAFTSNGYGLVNANGDFSKIISLILVWSGYILSGVSTALLTLALVSRYYKKRFKNLKSRIQKQNEQLKEINEKLDVLLENN